MGLRFRKTISILPGVRVNLGKSTQSISVGVPGFRKTINTKGKVTTTVGLPGTGLYYVDSKNIKKKDESRKKAEKPALEKPAAEKKPRAAVPAVERRSVQTGLPQARPVPRAMNMPAPGERFAAAQMNREKLLSIHKAADDTINWAEVQASAQAPDISYNQDMWAYYHSVADAVLSGDIDTYLSLIYEVNPLDDLLDYGGEFTFGTDDPGLMEVEFKVNEDALLAVKGTMRLADYNNFLQDFICSTSIRIARDIFALLPVGCTVVHAVLRDDTVLSVAFDRETMEKIRFGMIDPSDTMARFRVNMDFNDMQGFAPVDRLA